MDMINALLGKIYLAIGIVVVLALIAGAVFLYLYLQRKNQAQSTSVTENEAINLNYNSFRRTDATEYVKFEDIIDFRWGGAIVTDGGTRFIAGLAISGYDFDMASAEERYQSIIGMIRMTNVVSSPLMVRQDARKVDLSINVRKCEQCIERLQKELDSLQATYWELQGTVNELSTLGSDDARMHYQDLLGQNIGEQQAIVNMINEQQAIIQELHNTSGDNVRPQRNVSYLVDWIYDPSNFSSRALNKQEIYKEARRRLYDKLNILATALAQCGCKARKMSCEELLESEYAHFHPYSASKFRMENIFGSSYFHLFSTLDDSEIQREVAYEREQTARYYSEQVPYEMQLMEQERAREQELLRKYGYDGEHSEGEEDVDEKSIEESEQSTPDVEESQLEDQETSGKSSVNSDKKKEEEGVS